MMTKRYFDWLILGLTAIVSVVMVWIPTGMQRIYENFDGPYYVAVAKSWYNPQILRSNYSFPVPLEYYPAHLPLYPLLINIFSLTGLNHLQSMLLVNILAAIAGSLVIYYIFDKYKWGRPLPVALAWLFVWPRMWAVRSVGSPETIFGLLTILSLYGFGLKKYWLAGITGALAVLTKSPGILLLIAYGIWLLDKFRRTKELEIKAWPIILIPLALIGLFIFYGIRTGDFWAYFHSGDNIHLQALPFKVFDSSQPWVGNWWLEDILWIYFISAIGVWRAFKKSAVWGWWGMVFLTSILFVSHRDIARYSLPLVPVVLLGLADLLEHKEVRWVILLMLIPMYFYTLNFVFHNYYPIADWLPLL